MVVVWWSGAHTFKMCTPSWQAATWRVARCLVLVPASKVIQPVLAEVGEPPTGGDTLFAFQVGAGVVEAGAFSPQVACGSKRLLAALAGGAEGAIPEGVPASVGAGGASPPDGEGKAITGVQ